MKEYISGASPLAEWIRISLPVQGTQVQSLVQEDPTCRAATKPMPATTEPKLCSRAQELQLLSPHAQSPCSTARDAPQ